MQVPAMISMYQESMSSKRKRAGKAPPSAEAEPADADHQHRQRQQNQTSMNQESPNNHDNGRIDAVQIPAEEGFVAPELRTSTKQRQRSTDSRSSSDSNKVSDDTWMAQLLNLAEHTPPNVDEARVQAGTRKAATQKHRHHKQQSLTTESTQQQPQPQPQLTINHEPKAKSVTTEASSSSASTTTNTPNFLSQAPHTPPNHFLSRANLSNRIASSQKAQILPTAAQTGSTDIQSLSNRGPFLLTLTSFPYRIWMANPEATALLGSDIVGQSFFDLVILEGCVAPTMVSCPNLVNLFSRDDIVKLRAHGTETGSVFCRVETLAVMHDRARPDQGIKYYAVILERLIVGIGSSKIAYRKAL